MASEGLSLLAVPSQGSLLAFGGYNGRYHSTVQLFRPGTVLKDGHWLNLASQDAADLNLRGVPPCAACWPLKTTAGATCNTGQLFRPGRASQIINEGAGV